MTCTADRHGSTIWFYRAGCRCLGAIEANRAHHAARHLERITGPAQLRWRLTAELDDIAVERAVLGDPPARLSIGERRAAVARLTRLGRTAGQIAEQLRLNPRTVQRYRNGRHSTLAVAA